MDQNKLKNTLIQIANTLNSIEIKGLDNISKMYASIENINLIIQSLVEEENSNEETKENE